MRDSRLDSKSQNEEKKPKQLKNSPQRGVQRVGGGANEQLGNVELKLR